MPTYRDSDSGFPAYATAPLTVEPLIRPACVCAGAWGARDYPFIGETMPANVRALIDAGLAGGLSLEQLRAEIDSCLAQSPSQTKQTFPEDHASHAGTWLKDHREDDPGVPLRAPGPPLSTAPSTAPRAVSPRRGAPVQLRRRAHRQGLG